MSSETAAAPSPTAEAPAPSMGLIDIDKINMDVIFGFLTVHGMKFLAALAIFFIGKWILGRIVALLKRMMTRAKVDATLVGFLGNIVFGIGIALVVVAALAQMGIETTSLAAVIAAAGLAIGLALQGSLSNFAAGIMIILFRFFKAGDYIEAAGTGGTVENISIFTTELVTPDNKFVIIPNSNITTDTIINYSAKATRRLDLVIGVAYDADLKKAQNILTRIVEADDRILKDPPPQIAVLALGASSVDFAVRPWVNSSDYWDVHFHLMQTIKTELDDAGIAIPFPQRDVHLFIDGNGVEKLNTPSKSSGKKKTA